jgi:hypothetical protein
MTAKAGWCDEERSAAEPDNGGQRRWCGRNVRRQSRTHRHRQNASTKTRTPRQNAGAPAKRGLEAKRERTAKTQKAIRTLQKPRSAIQNAFARLKAAATKANPPARHISFGFAKNMALQHDGLFC